MRCLCGCDYNGNFCPECGRRADVGQVYDAQVVYEQTQPNDANSSFSNNGNATEEKESKFERGMNKFYYIRWRILVPGCAIIYGLYMLLFRGFALTGLSWIGAAVPLLPPVANRYPDNELSRRFLFVALFFVGFLFVPK